MPRGSNYISSGITKSGKLESTSVSNSEGLEFESSAVCGVCYDVSVFHVQVILWLRVIVILKIVNC